MKDQYDIAIIGAGPSGLFCAYELIRHGITNITIIEAGVSYANKACPLTISGKCHKCAVCSNLAGFGGAALYNPGKLSFYPAGSGLDNILNNQQKCKNIYQDVNDIFLELGLKIENDDIPYNFKQMENSDVKVKYYKSAPIPKEKLNQIAKNLSLILENNIDIHYKSRVIDIKVHNDYFDLQIEGRDDNLKAQKVVVATGEFGFKWWKNIQDKNTQIKTKTNAVDIGIRIELPSELLEEIWKYHKDIKLKTYSNDGSEIRTYCMLKNSKTVNCNYGTQMVVDAISSPNATIGGVTIFNRLTSSQLNGQDPLCYAIDLLNRFYTSHREPHYFTMGEFIKEPDSIFNEQFQLPYFIHSNILQAINRFNTLIPGLTKNSNKVVFPAIDNLWRKSEITDNMETSVKNLYVTGDACGHLRGIMQACVTGLICAEGIIASK